MAEPRVWAALTIEAPDGAAPAEMGDAIALLLDDWHVTAIEDLASFPLPPEGLWDPTYPPIPEPPPSPVRWRAFFESTEERDAAREAIARRLPDVNLVVANVADEDWAARSQRSLTAVRAGTFIVAPPWDMPAAAEAVDVIVIEPSMGFGTGHHATTRLCLRALSSLDLSGKTALDLGTGSGVLAFAAAIRGATSVVAVDIDPDAIAAARASAALNTLRVRVDFQVADFRSHGDSRADVVLANLTGGMLTTAAVVVRRLVAPGGTLVVSGFDLSEERQVREALGRATVEDRYEEEGWVAVTLSD
ncbi:MAG: 50S ribosomal protein L11 methyltransferase [Acidobacteria bacterium]|nr:50S ribosomal protein L11 methyltransferase [Acidobacteriota bacterium]